MFHTHPHKIETDQQPNKMKSFPLSSLYLAMTITLAAMSGPAHAAPFTVPETGSLRGPSSADREFGGAASSETSTRSIADLEAHAKPSNEARRSLERRRWHRRTGAPTVIKPKAPTAAPTVLKTKAPTSATISACPVPDLRTVRCAASDPVECTRNGLKCPYERLCFATVAGFTVAECPFVQP
jgi:hypothetical protein